MIRCDSEADSIVWMQEEQTKQIGPEIFLISGFLFFIVKRGNESDCDARTNSPEQPKFALGCFYFLEKGEGAWRSSICAGHWNWQSGESDL